MNGKKEIAARSSFQKLEQRLVLPAWLNSLFGYERNRDLPANIREAAEGFALVNRYV